jgi:DNA-binding MarR family transcriptional regulator
MKIIQQAFKLDKDKYYVVHLGILNAILPVKLTDKELEVLAAFMGLDENIIEDSYFNPVARKKVLKKLVLSPAGLSNHLKSMLDKGFLTKNSITNVISIKEFLLPETDGQGYQFKIMKNEAIK